MALNSSGKDQYPLRATDDCLLGHVQEQACLDEANDTVHVLIKRDWVCNAALKGAVENHIIIIGNNGTTFMLSYLYQGAQGLQPFANRRDGERNDFNGYGRA